MKNNLLIIILFALILLSCKSSKSALFVIAGQSNAMGVGDETKSVFKTDFSYEYNSQLDSIIP